jgi:Pumilio-family RNA binding repeat
MLSIGSNALLRVQAIHDLVRDNCRDVATHRHGCCVLQRCMDYAASGKKRELVMAAAGHGLELSQNAFGNYVVQVRARCNFSCLFFFVLATPA